MPPKKKGTKGGKKKGKKGQKKVEPRYDPEPYKEGTREFYLNKIKQLQVQTERYQKRHAQLVEENKQIRIDGQGFAAEEGLMARAQRDRDYQHADTTFRDKYKDMQEDREYRAIKAAMEKDTATMNKLNEQIAEAIEAQELQREHYTAQTRELRAQDQETRSSLTGQRTMLVRRLHEVEEFKDQKESLLEKAAGLERLMEERENQHQENINNIIEHEKRGLARDKKDMLDNVRLVSHDYRQESKRMVPDTITRTDTENKIALGLIDKMDGKMEDLEEQNQELKEGCRHQAQHIRHLEKRQNDLARETYTSKRLIALLKAKSKDLESEMKEARQLDELVEEQEDIKVALQEDLAASKQLTAQARRQRKENSIKKQMQEKELTDLKTESARVKTALTDSTGALRRLKVVEDEMCSASPLPASVDSTLHKVLNTIETVIDSKTTRKGKE